MRFIRQLLLVGLGVVLFGWASAQGAFIIEVDIDGLDDGVLTYNPLFSFGGDTTSASQSAASTAFGMTGGDSIFGGNGSMIDTYIFTYDPSIQADNLAIPPGMDLGYGILATGLAGGNPGTYAVYVTWPFTQNVSMETTYLVETAGDMFTVTASQNDLGNAWVKLGEIDWTAGPITLRQESGNASFVSMRSAGVLFEPVPEPSVLALFGFGILAMLFRRRVGRQP